MDAENLEDLIAMRRRVETERKRKRKKKNNKSAETTALVSHGVAEQGEKGREHSLARVSLFGAYGGRSADEEVVDPYYGDGKGFEVAFEQVERFSRGFLRSLEEGVGGGGFDGDGT